ncbi:hypothetical protein CI610_03155 [invertebrate metagenome]|uniref:Uncharacterized protein n=1 Tax=invertebrate metagenome TaxID=1711999 RepID=A0A2H9T3Y4_9ZZZZ
MGDSYDDDVVSLSYSGDENFDFEGPKPASGRNRHVETEVIVNDPDTDPSKPLARGTRTQTKADKLTVNITNKKRAGGKQTQSAAKKAKGNEQVKLDSVLTAIQNLTTVIADNEKRRDVAPPLTSGFLEEEGETPAAQTLSGANLSLFDSGDEVSEIGEEQDFDFQLADIYDKHKLGPAIQSEKVATSVTTAVRQRRTCPLSQRNIRFLEMLKRLFNRKRMVRCGIS